MWSELTSKYCSSSERHLAPKHCPFLTSWLVPKHFMPCEAYYNNILDQKMCCAPKRKSDYRIKCRDCLNTNCYWIVDDKVIRMTIDQTSLLLSIDAVDNYNAYIFWRSLIGQKTVILPYSTAENWTMKFLSQCKSINMVAFWSQSNSCWTANRYIEKKQISLFLGVDIMQKCSRRVPK